MQLAVVFTVSQRYSPGTFPRAWPPNLMTIGRHSRSPSGCGGSIRCRGACGSRTSPSTVMCICRRGRHSTPACFTVCAVIVRYGVRSASGPPTAAARSATPSPSESVRSEADAPEVAGHRERLTRASKRRCGGLARSELGKVAQVHSPVIHQWLALTQMVGMANPPVIAVVIAIIETLAALALIFGCRMPRSSARRSSRSASGRVPRRSTCPSIPG